MPLYTMRLSTSASLIGAGTAVAVICFGSAVSSVRGQSQKSQQTNAEQTFGRPPASTEIPRDKWVLPVGESAVQAAALHLGAIVAQTDPDSGTTSLAPHTVQLFTPKVGRGPCVGPGKRVWLVIFPKAEFSLPSDEGKEDTPPMTRRVECYLDPGSGYLERIDIVDETNKRDAPAEPDGGTTVRQLWNAGQEVWGNIADHPAKVPLIDALDTVETKMGGVRTAKRIVVHHVDWSMMKSDFRAMWSIDLRGIPPIDAAHPGVPENARDHLRHIVDSTTGKWIMATTTPQLEDAGQGKPPVDKDPPPATGA